MNNPGSSVKRDYDEQDERRGSCPVVGVGASAGGLEAFTQLLRHLPATSGMAFVLVQHLAPQHESVLAELLSVHTQMPVKQALQEIKVEANSIYVIPPNACMELKGGVLLLTPRAYDDNSYLPIDYFFCSLADDQKGRAIGVILSGTAADGTIGLKQIKLQGGITFAQDESAKFIGMPQSAIAANIVDFVLPPEGIASELSRIAQHWYLSPDAATDDSLLDSTAMQRILALVQEKKGVDFGHYKRPTMQRRVSRRLALLDKATASDYLNLLERDEVEVNALFDDLLINVTEFFRDPATFDVLANKVLPRLLAGRRSDEPIRVWIPGCSSGEEVYSVAICIAEYLGQTKQTFPIQIFGTDLSERAIESARAGKYAEAISSVVSPERLSRFFIRLETGGYQIAGFVREFCIFSRQDLTRDPPLSRMDLISCRNVLIYFGPILQRRAMSVFSYALKPAGCLVLGHSEGVHALADHFVILDQEHKIFCRNLQVLQPTLDLHQIRAVGLAPSVGLPEKAPDERNSLDREVDEIVLANYSPSGFLFDAQFQLLKLRGDMRPYLASSEGADSLDVSSLIHEDLAGPLRSAVQDAAANNTLCRRNQVPVRRNGFVDYLDLVVYPVFKPGVARCFLALIEEPLNGGERKPNRKSNLHSNRSSEQALEKELEATRTYLQSVIEELRSSNEEAQSTNEELQSINEELQTAKEELQSSNEELTTTNDELQSRNKQLTETNNDLINLLSSMRIPVVMLNSQLRIRRFTPSSERALNLIPSDVGRPISDLKPRINIPDLEEQLIDVIRSTRDFEREVQDRNGRWYSLRITPYRGAGSRVEGAVLQLLDIDELKRTVEQAEQARKYAEAIIATVQEPLAVLDRDLRIETANQSFYEIFKVSEKEILKQSIFAIGGRRWDIPKLRSLLETIARSADSPVQEDVEVDHNVEGMGWRTFRLSGRTLRREGDRRQILLALEDVTDRKRTAEAKYRRLFETAKDGILVIDAESGEISDANPYFLNLFGIARGDLLGKRFWETRPLSQLNNPHHVFDRLQVEEAVRISDLTLQSSQGREIDVDIVCNVYLEGERRLGQFNIRDSTERKRFDAQLQQSAKLESLGLLAGGIAHDFNNLLTGVMGNAALILDATPATSPDREPLREILKSSQRAADLTRQMLAYSGQGRFVIRVTDFSELVRDISALVRSSIPKSVDLELLLSTAPLYVEADATQVQQLVMNLVINGAEAIGEGKRGSVRVITGHEVLDLATIEREFPGSGMTPGEFVFLEVIDSGCGMDSVTQAKIFDPFFTTKFTGRGLGLAAAQGIVRGHRGAIGVRSAPGRGTSFKVVFPESRSERQPAYPMPNEVEDLSGTGLILVVDDEEIVRNLTISALKRYGYDVVTASNGDAALQLIREHGQELGLVILDLMMPVMSGEQTLSAIKMIHPELPVLLSSGYDEPHAIKHLDSTLLAGFVQKPYVIGVLLKMVKSAIRRQKR